MESRWLLQLCRLCLLEIWILQLLISTLDHVLSNRLAAHGRMIYCPELTTLAPAGSSNTMRFVTLPGGTHFCVHPFVTDIACCIRSFRGFVLGFLLWVDGCGKGKRTSIQSRHCFIWVSNALWRQCHCGSVVLRSFFVSLVYVCNFGYFLGHCSVGNGQPYCIPIWKRFREEITNSLPVYQFWVSTECNQQIFHLCLF